MVSESGHKATSLGIGNSNLGTLVIQTAHLGDVVLTLPLIQRLADRHGPVDVVTTPAALPLVETHPAVHRVIPFDKHGADKGLGGLLRVGRALRPAGYARAFLPHGSLRSAALAWLAGAAERIGFEGAPGAIACTARVRRPAAGHMSTRLAALAGTGAPPSAPWLVLTAPDRTRAEDWLSARGLVEPFIALAPGSRWGTKRWPYFPDLASVLEVPAVVLGGPEDAELGTAVVRAAPGRVRDAVGALTLRESAAVIERSVLLVTNDSVALHLATALGRPVVAIFGPTVTRFGFGPIGVEDQVIEQTGLPCRPCSPHGPMTCPLGHHRCMRELQVARVLEAIHARLRGAATS